MHPTHSIQVVSNDFEMARGFHCICGDKCCVGGNPPIGGIDAAIGGRPARANLRKNGVSKSKGLKCRCQEWVKNLGLILRTTRIHQGQLAKCWRLWRKMAKLRVSQNAGIKETKMFICHSTLLPDPLRPSAITTFKTSNAKWRHSVCTSAKQTFEIPNKEWTPR